MPQLRRAASRDRSARSADSATFRRIRALRELVGDAFAEFSGWDGRARRTRCARSSRGPGSSRVEFLEGRRARYISPLRLYLMASVVYFLLAAAAPTRVPRRRSLRRASNRDATANAAHTTDIDDWRRTPACGDELSAERPRTDSRVGDERAARAPTGSPPRSSTIRRDFASDLQRGRCRRLLLRAAAGVRGDPRALLSRTRISPSICTSRSTCTRSSSSRSR